MHIPQDRVEKTLFVIGAISNPPRYKSRYKLARDWINFVRNSGAVPILVEAGLNDREFALQQHGPASREPIHEPVSFGPPPNPPRAALHDKRYLQDYLKFKIGHLSYIWLKEVLQNLGAAHLPNDAKYIAFMDCDITLARPDWVSETLHQLQVYEVVQMWSHAIDLSPTYEPLAHHLSFAYCMLHDMPVPPMPGYYYGRETPGKAIFTHHPGWVWGWRRSALNTVGGLIDHGILGAGDNHMARALFGLGEKSYHPGVSKAYKRRVMEWQERAKALFGNVGCVDGTLLHMWHGSKKGRKYADRWRILVDHKFDPDFDLQKDINGINCLVKGRKPALRDAVRGYFKQRGEDSIDVPPTDYKMFRPPDL